MVRRRNSTAAEEVARSSFSSLTRAGLVRKDIQPPKLVPPFPWIDNCLMVTISDFLKNGSQGLIGKFRIGSVAQGWLFTMCCWEAAAHTIDLGATHNYQCFKISTFGRKCGWVGQLNKLKNEIQIFCCSSFWAFVISVALGVFYSLTRVRPYVQVP